MKRSVDLNATTARIFEADLGNHFVPRRLVDGIGLQEDRGLVQHGILDVNATAQSVGMMAIVASHTIRCKIQAAMRPT